MPPLGKPVRMNLQRSLDVRRASRIIDPALAIGPNEAAQKYGRWPGISSHPPRPWFFLPDNDRDRVDDAEVLARIEALVIPPAWKDVWISPHPNGHIQAVGTDVAGRRQYLYHEHWQTERSEEKFDRAVSLAKQLPRLAP